MNIAESTASGAFLSPAVLSLDDLERMAKIVAEKPKKQRGLRLARWGRVSKAAHVEEMPTALVEGSLHSDRHIIFEKKPQTYVIDIPRDKHSEAKKEMHSSPVEVTASGERNTAEDARKLAEQEEKHREGIRQMNEERRRGAAIAIRKKHIEEVQLFKKAAEARYEAKLKAYLSAPTFEGPTTAPLLYVTFPKENGAAVSHRSAAQAQEIKDMGTALKRSGLVTVGGLATLGAANVLSLPLLEVAGGLAAFSGVAFATAAPIFYSSRFIVNTLRRHAQTLSSLSVPEYIS